ncbi:hypothetical protein KY284_035945 [Solanum tuberosum]|nr:hypothetical protein KY284_035945 [Solanum tuberosum]
MDIHSHDVDQILELSGDSLTGTSSKSFPMLENDIVQGIDDDLEIIIIRLTGRLSDLEIVTILGMHGINKTTLAKKAYDQLTISYHFDILSWVTILKNLEDEMDESELADLVEKNLKVRRYLVVVDEIWSRDVWDNIRGIILNYNNGS